MATVAQNFMKLFRGSSSGSQAETPQGPQKLTRRSSGLGELARLWESETPYQYARVTQDATGTRRLELNEGLAVHSLYEPGSYLTNDYWDGMLVLPFTGRAAAHSD